MRKLLIAGITARFTLLAFHAPAGAGADPTGQVVGVLTTVRQELGWPVANDDGGGGGGGGDSDDGDDAAAPNDTGVLGGGAQVAGNGGALPRTGAGSSAPLALGFIALGSPSASASSADQDSPAPKGRGAASPGTGLPSTVRAVPGEDFSQVRP